MSSQKILVVCGATGTQGRSVVNNILADPKTKAGYKIRGITRDPSSAKAKELSDLGVECVAGDLNEKSSLVKAFDGAHSVFGVTNFWEKAQKSIELKQGRNIADAAKEAGVQHLVWSSLNNVTEDSKGKITTVEHFDGKAEIEAYIRQIGVPFTAVLAGFYMSNFATMLRQDPASKTYQMAFPYPSTAPMALIDTYGDFGKFVKAALKAGPTGKRILASQGYYSPDEILSEFQKVYPQAGKGAKYTQLTDEQFKGILKGSGMPDHGATDLAGNMQWIGDFGYYAGAKLEPSIDMVEEKLTSWGEFAKAMPAFKDLS